MRSHTASIILAFCAAVAVNAAPISARSMDASMAGMDMSANAASTMNMSPEQMAAMTEDEIYENTKRDLKADTAAAKAEGISVEDYQYENSKRDLKADEAAAKAMGVSLEDYQYETQKRDLKADEAAAKAEGVSLEDYQYEHTKRALSAEDITGLKAEGMTDADITALEAHMANSANEKRALSAEDISGLKAEGMTDADITALEAHVAESESGKRSLPADQVAALKAAGQTDAEIAAFEADEASVASRDMAGMDMSASATSMNMSPEQMANMTEDEIYENTKRDLKADEAAAKAMGVSLEDYQYETQK